MARGKASDDQLLMERVRKGDLRAFDALCLRLEPPLFGYALRLTGDPGEAEETAQETLFRLYRMAREGAYRNGSRPRALAFSIVHNLAMDVHRRAARSQRLLSEPPPPPAPPSPATELELLRDEIDKAVAELPANQRAALLLRTFCDLSYREIAETLGSTEASVKTWIFRARKRLAELLDRDGQYIGESRHGV